MSLYIFICLVYLYYMYSDTLDIKSRYTSHTVTQLMYFIIYHLYVYLSTMYVLCIIVYTMENRGHTILPPSNHHQKHITIMHTKKKWYTSKTQEIHKWYNWCAWHTIQIQLIYKLTYNWQQLMYSRHTLRNILDLE